MPKQSQLFIIDDSPIVRQGLTHLVTKEPGFALCGQSTDAAQALNAIDELKPNLVIMDIALRGVNGIELIRQIKARHPEVRVLVLSMLEESLYAERVLRAGASGYVMKEEPTERLSKAFRRVLEGEIYISKTIANKILGKFTLRGPALQNSPIERLSNRELQVFRQIAEGHGTQRIAKSLGLSPKTVDTYREHIKAKLKLADAGAVREYAIRWSRSDRLN